MYNSENLERSDVIQIIRCPGAGCNDHLNGAGQQFFREQALNLGSREALTESYF